MEIRKINMLGMELTEWKHKSCRAEFGVADNYATLYYIESKEKGKGHASELLIVAKKLYEYLGKKFGGSVALSKEMRSIYRKLKIHEYDE